MGTNKENLNRAKAVKEDEFYTRIEDIEREMVHYKDYFKDKIVYCNCDDRWDSNFFKYFSLKFEELGLKKLITTGYNEAGSSAAYLQYNGDSNGNRMPDKDEIEFQSLVGNGDFRSEECIELLKEADIVVTNPPFSLFREFVEQLMTYDKDFIILGSQNAAYYKEVFKLIQGNKMWLGNYSGDMSFRVPDYYEPRETRYWQDEDGQKWRSLGNICWFTNLEIPRRREEIVLYKSYNSEEYPTYDNFNVIEVGKYKEIPKDYDGVMGVPITYLGRHNPDQFEIVGVDYQTKEGLLPELVKEEWNGSLTAAYLGGKRKFARVFIRNKNPEK